MGDEVEKAVSDIAEEITNEAGRIVMDLCRKYLAGAELDIDRLQTHQLSSEDINNITVNAYYGIKLLGSINISLGDDLEVSYEVISEFND